jgi:hypothetical protein
LAGQSSTQLFSSLTQVIDVICSKVSWLSDMKPHVLCWRHSQPGAGKGWLAKVAHSCSAA